MRDRREGRERDLVGAALSLAAESGAVVDIIKKHVYHGHDLDVDELKKRLESVEESVKILKGVTYEKVDSDRYFDRGLDGMCTTTGKWP